MSAVSYTSEVFCLSKDCILSSDWLTYNASRTGVYIVSTLALFLMFGGIGARTDKQNQAYNVFGHLCIILSLYLRDKLWVDRSDSAEKYKASLFFNYLSAIWFSLANVIPYSALEAVVLLFVAGFTKQGAANTIFHVVHVMLMILMLIATILMFNTLDARGVDISVYMTQSVAFAILALALTVAIFTVVHACKAKTKSWFKIAVTLVRCTLLTLWASFMASRMFVSLDSLVRDSEAMLYFFNFMPLVFLGLLPNSLPVLLHIDPYSEFVVFKKNVPTA